MSLDTDDYLDGNAVAGELSNIFAMDVTAAEGQCAHCGATKRFAEARLYMQNTPLHFVMGGKSLMHDPARKVCFLHEILLSSSGNVN